MSFETLNGILNAVLDQLLKVVQYPITSTERIYWLYLISSLLLALYVYWLVTREKANLEDGPKSFLGFVFPKEVWRHPSAWLDVRYFFFHQMVRLVLYVTLTGAVIALTYNLVAVDTTETTPPNNVGSGFRWETVVIPTLYMFGLVAVLDLAAYWIHYLQHKIPILWEFHKVHHSAEVMHPLTNYREHPIDNIFYAINTGIVYGGMAGIAKNIFGYIPIMPTLLGIPVLLFLFNFLGYNLRHSHIWLRWPGELSKVFASPAHHQVHHSYHPEHINKNFSFIFPWWDVLFGTYCVPEDNRDVKFGIAEDYEQEFNSCLGIYFVPFRNAWRNVWNRLQGREAESHPQPNEKASPSDPT